MLGAWPDRKRCGVRRLVTAGLAPFAALVALAGAAQAISIELKDVAADRIERQRAFVEGRVPLARTPDVVRLSQRLADAGVSSGSPVLLRVFKETSELELWIEKGDTFILFATYPICHWSGSLGPKLREGDKQTPEGFYTITSRQLRHIGRWPRSINLGFPNAYDRALDRDGSYILMHGGCSSVGCFAMTNPVMAEVYGLTKAAITNGQRYVPFHVFPFRLTDEALAAQAASPWYGFWTSLQEGYTSFARTGRPPRVGVCNGAYTVEDAPPKSAQAETEPKRQRTSRSSMMLGALRVGCPEPVVVTADGNGRDHAGAAAATKPH